MWPMSIVFILSISSCKREKPNLGNYEAENILWQETLFLTIVGRELPVYILEIFTLFPLQRYRGISNNI